MSVAVFLKNNLKNIPPSIGQIINRIPYTLRPGLSHIYKERREEIKQFERFNLDEKKKFIYSKMGSILNHAYANVPAYKTIYDREGFHPSQFKDFDDIKLIPIINKSILKEFDLDQRSFPRKGRYIVNTGGSSGTPFNLFIEPNSMGHEWAHMHYIWEKLGYKSSDLKIVFGGRSDLSDVVEYDVVRNHFAVDIYADYKLVSQKLKKILQRYKIKYLHGYPSSIYDFALYCEQYDSELHRMLSHSIKGVFLGSEYPHPQYRQIIESVFDTKTISWYGHTERAVLAYEKNKEFNYEPFGTYGFAESLELKENNFNLIATSYYNYASPLIRYNTEDIISNVKSEDGILKSFQVTDGRSGEFVLDKNHKKINLTGLIFGRHHDLFNHSKFIQIKQIDIGKIEIHFVSDNLSLESAKELFDSSNLNLDLVFVKKSEPVRTSSGKINLLIK